MYTEPTPVQPWFASRILCLAGLAWTAAGACVLATLAAVLHQCCFSHHVSQGAEASTEDPGADAAAAMDVSQVRLLEVCPSLFFGPTLPLCEC